MPLLRHMAALAFVFAATLCAGERDAVIFCAKSGEQVLHEENASLCKRTAKLLSACGFPKDRVSIFIEGAASTIPGASEPTSDALLLQLDKLSQSMSPDDELWLFIYGDANENQRGVSIAAKGRRLYGKTLAETLDKIPAKQFVLCMNRQSAGLMDAFVKDGRVVATACSDPGQTNPPLFPKFLLDAWEKSPSTTILEVLKKAGEATEAHYKNSGLAIAETAQVFDGRSIVRQPFDGSPAASLSVSLSSSDPGAGKTDDTPKGDTPSLTPATPETKSLIGQAAKAASRHAGFQAFVMSHDRKLSVKADCSTVRDDELSLYYIEDSAAEQFASQTFEDSPPQNELKILSARIIYPDGSSRDAISKSVPYDLKLGRRITQLKFPGARKGCLFEMKLQVSGTPKFQIPFFCERFGIQREIPVESASVSISYPKDKAVSFKCPSLKPELSDAPYAKMATFKFKDVPAFEPLPGDPPMDDCAVGVTASSLKDWDEFAGWAGRIVSSNSELDDETKQLVESLTKDKASDAEKLKAIYEFLCELRYETTPVGASSFRPRKPSEICSSRYGDCKDKANALVAMARASGVEGGMALLNRGGTSDPSFPSWQFNHAIAFFPKLAGYPDGLWCDATDGSTPFGSLPPGDVGRDAFVLGEKPGFKKVLLSGAQRNFRTETFELAVSPDGSVTGSMRIDAGGLEDYKLRMAFKRLGPLRSQFAAQQILDGCLEGLSAGAPQISPPGDLSRPFSLSAPLTGTLLESPLENPRLPIDLWGMLSMESRDRPLVMNDGQPAAFRRIVKISGSLPKGGKGWNVKRSVKSPFAAEVSIRNDADRYESDIAIDLYNPTVEAASYKSMRDAAANLMMSLKHGKETDELFKEMTK